MYEWNLLKWKSRSKYFIIDILDNHDQYTIEHYIGGGDFFVEGLFEWQDRTHVTVSHWKLNEPSDGGHVEDCIAILPSGYWNDVPCDITLPFVCQIEYVFNI